MDKKNKFAVLILIIFFIVGFFLIKNAFDYPRTWSAENIKYVNIGGSKVKVELALTSQAQELGLSGRAELAEDEGMLFVFSVPDKYYFWMKDMNFAIDMIWISEDLKIIYIKKDARPELYPETYGPEENAKYILEVNSGFSDKNNLKVGDKIKFIYQ